MRTFLALPIDDSVRKDFHLALSEMRKELPNLSWVKSDSLHITLHFLGEIEVSVAQQLADDLSPVIEQIEAFPVKLGELGAFPPSGMPKVLFTKLLRGKEQAGFLYEAARPIVEKYVRGRGKKRDFHAHLTIARVKAKRLNEREKGLLANLDLLKERVELPVRTFQADRCILYESVLRRQGAEYRVVREYPLLSQSERG
ncbi:MAG: RNA 2',3'-cyclic phosphodiesterase [Spirochaetales bacterium]|nr:RNA 2',3'-cyclic phosphodiesterase [Spirochaetales bacterium]MCF7938228.1 RNA 2',3'-cyclic phosphodiesterase [Spirochaetales bacterium]